MTSQSLPDLQSSASKVTCVILGHAWSGWNWTEENRIILGDGPTTALVSPLYSRTCLLCNATEKTSDYTITVALNERR